jgi:Ca2+-binding RTX toxin-like protein
MNRLGRPFFGKSSLRPRGKRQVATAAAFAVVTTLFTPWAMSPADAAVGQGFNLNLSDIRFILRQIKISEAHAASATPGNACGTLLGTGPQQIPNGNQQGAELPWGLRTVDGTCNNLLPGKAKLGAADTVFPRSAPARFRGAESGDPDGPGPAPSGPTSYTQKRGTVIDSQPRTVSNLVVDQTPANPAAVAAAGDGAVPDAGGTLPIPNVAPDVGLSAPFNSLFTLFGQFFDHGLDLTTKGGGTVFMPLKPDDPLFDADSPTNFMILTRATNQPGPDGITGDRPGTPVDESADDVQEATNSTTSFVDQNQTYTSHPSHQVFLREYVLNGAGDPVENGRLLGGHVGPGAPTEGLATWQDVKDQARDLLGIILRDTDVSNVPMLATDPYGNFTPGPNGYPQLVTEAGLVEGSAAGTPIPPNVIRTGHAFLDDIAHHAVPVDRSGAALPADTLPDGAEDTGATTDDGRPGTYDNEMLAAHFIAGDGRVNENIGLTSVHHVFHSEHNRLMADIDSLISTETLANQADWHNATGPAWEYGQRLFQAARFVTEMEYQHLVFEEFARKVQPMVNLFGEGGTGYHTELDPSIRAEFAHAVYRFGHSMLTETMARRNSDNSNNDIGLVQAFLNPPEFFNGGTAGILTADAAAGSVVRGMTRQVGNEIDEFVTEALRNNLLGLPLDLATINMARAREAGVPPLNHARRAFFRESGNSALKPYESWADFNFSLKNTESLVNFIAAYGTHDTITAETTVAGKRAAAQALIAVAADPAPVDEAAKQEAFDFLNGLGAWADDANGFTTTGVDDIDLWVGGLAEKPFVFGGMLGATFNYVFETQMEDLQEADRFYYLSRTAGLNLLTQLEGNSFSELIMRNTDVVSLPADSFSRPDFVFDLAKLGTTGPILDDSETEVNEAQVLTRQPNGTIRFGGTEHTTWNGTAGNDRMQSSEGDDTLRANDGDDSLQGGDGNDNHIGGLGDDVMQDLAGDDVLKGGDGDDTLSSGQGFGGDLNQGGRGKDFILGGNDITETFAGPGDDFVFAGDAEDTVFGDDGDDWIEAGKGPFNLLQGDNGAPFQDDPNEPGHDVLDGDGGEQDYDSEGGDDIMLAGPGIQRSEGMLGFDWVTHKFDPLPADSDMDFTGLLPPGVETNRDRFDLVESLSGWNDNDILRGDDRTDVDLGVEHQLNQAGIDRITGLAGVLPAGTTSYNAGNIIIGGAGNDTIEGRGGDDIIDGDAWLNTRLSVRTNPANPSTEIGSAEGMTKPYLTGSTTTLRQAVLARTVDPGNIVIVREILNGAGGTDTAVFSGPRGEYDITFGTDSVTVTHTRGAATDGTDTLRNVERLQFTDQALALSAPAAPTIGTATATASGSVNLGWTAPAANGSPAVTGFEIVVSDGRIITGIPANATTHTITGLTNDTEYTFQVRAINAVGAGALSAASNPATPKTPVGPQITSRTPGVNATGVALGANVDVIFDVAMAGGGFTTSTMTLRNPAGAQIAATVGWNAVERRARLNPNVRLAPNTTYQVKLTGGPAAIRSRTGVPLAGPTEWSFTTAPPPAPTVTATTPAPDAVNVLRGANLAANFSAPVTGVGASSVVLTNTATGLVVPRVLTTNATSNRVTINPNAALDRNRVYRVDIIGGPTRIRLATGGTPLVSRSWTFTSAP